jgi:hypothetical protein
VDGVGDALHFDRVRLQDIDVALDGKLEPRAIGPAEKELEPPFVRVECRQQWSARSWSRPVGEGRERAHTFAAGSGAEDRIPRPAAPGKRSKWGVFDPFRNESKTSANSAF